MSPRNIPTLMKFPPVFKAKSNRCSEGLDIKYICDSKTSLPVKNKFSERCLLKRVNFTVKLKSENWNPYTYCHKSTVPLTVTMSATSTCDNKLMDENKRYVLELLKRGQKEFKKHMLRMYDQTYKNKVFVTRRL